jgi:hypothetical protein
MLKRLFWLLVGAGFGFGVSFWVVRTIRQTMERYTPERVSTDLAAALRGLGQDIRAAVAEGREAMREREAELRAELDAGRRPGPAGGGPRGSGNGSQTGGPRPSGDGSEDAGEWRWTPRRNP